MNGAAVALGGFAQRVQVRPAIAWLEEDGLPIDTARNDMLRDTGDEIPGLSRHAIRLVAGRSEDQRRKVRFDPNIDIYWGVSTSETLGSPSVILRVMRAPRRLAGFCCGNPE